jgi:hypothetical protein
MIAFKYCPCLNASLPFSLNSSAFKRALAWAPVHVLHHSQQIQRPHNSSCRRHRSAVQTLFARPLSAHSQGPTVPATDATDRLCRPCLHALSQHVRRAPEFLLPTPQVGCADPVCTLSTTLRTFAGPHNSSHENHISVPEFLQPTHRTPQMRADTYTTNAQENSWPRQER